MAPSTQLSTEPAIRARRYVPADPAEKRFSAHRSSQRKIGGGPTTSYTVNQPPAPTSTTVITTSRDTLDRFLATRSPQTTQQSQCLPLSWHRPTPPSSSLMRTLRSPYEKSPLPTHHRTRDVVAYHSDVARIADSEDHNRPTSCKISSRPAATRSSPSGPLCSPRYDDQTQRPTYFEDPPCQYSSRRIAWGPGSSNEC